MYIFGGVINQRTVTNEFWEYNPKNGKWTDLSSHDDSVQAFPLPVAGHTAHIVGSEMHVLFGYNPYEGYLYIPQIYSFGWYYNFLLELGLSFSVRDGV